MSEQEQPTVEVNRDETHPGAGYSIAETEFMMAIDAYKRRNQRPFPTWREVLAVAHALGYRKVAEPTELPRPVAVVHRSEPATKQNWDGRDRRKRPRPAPRKVEPIPADEVFKRLGGN